MLVDNFLANEGRPEGEKRMRAEEGFKVILSCLEGRQTPKQLFLEENAEKISMATTHLLKNDPSLNGCHVAAHAHVSADLWGKADKAFYEEKAQAPISVEDGFV